MLADARSDPCPGPNATNLGTGAVFETIAASRPGETRELAACTFFERGLVLDNRDITIRGQGPGLTIIDGDSQPNKILFIRGGGESTIERLTIRNGLEDVTDGDPSGAPGVRG